MVDVENIFRNRKSNEVKLLNYGFTKKENKFCYKTEIMDGQFIMTVDIIANNVEIKLIEKALNEEYGLIHVKNAKGSFVNSVSDACDKVLIEIAQKCFDTDILKAEQTKRITEYIRASFGAEPEFLWEKLPDCAAFRRADNRKWFAVIMTVENSRLKLAGGGSTEIIDIKAPAEKVEELLKKPHFLKAYHMNKKHWITVCLNGSISDNELFKLISLSYETVG